MKKITGITMVMIIAGISAWLISASYQKIKAKNKLEAGLNRIPAFSFIDNKGEKMSVRRISSGEPLIIIYFDSDCGHCKEEAQQITSDRKYLKGIKILFVSLEPIDKIREFGKKFDLPGESGILLGQIDEKTAFDILGVVSTPQIFIYNGNGDLKKQFRGTTKTETLVKYANM